MKSLMTRRWASWIPLVLALSLIASMVIVGCDSPAPTATRRLPAVAGTATTAPASVTRTSAAPPTVAPTKKPATATTVPQDAPPRSVPVPSGGTLTVPPGALPRSAEVTVSPACMPALSGEPKAVGQAVAVETSEEPARALTLRLPLPEGVTDPKACAIRRVEPDGSTTQLETRVEGKELVAATPGGGVFVAVQPSTLGVQLSGPTELVPGELATFAPIATWPLDIKEETWSAHGGVTLATETTHAVVVRAGEALGWGEVRYECLDGWTGLRFFACRPIEVVLSPQPFKVSVNTVNHVVFAGDEVQTGAALYGAFERPIAWSWEFGDGTGGGPETTAQESSTFGLPAKSYAPSELITDYTITVTAKDAKGREVRGSTNVRVMRDKNAYRASLEGPLHLTWNGATLAATYRMSAVGGVPPHTFQFFQYPGKGWSSGSGDTWEQRLEFPEPGEYLLVGLARDSQATTTTSANSLHVMVEGGEALKVDLDVVPGSANQPAAASVDVRGGVLVVAGKKAGYTVTLDWGDGTEPLVEEGVGGESTSLEGAFLPKTHNYARPGTYTVRVEVCDASGQRVVVTKRLVIPEPSVVLPTVTRTPTRTPYVGPTRTRTPTKHPTITPKPTNTRTPTPTRTRTRTPTPTRATRTPTPTPTETDEPSGRLLVWVRQDQVVVNVNNDPKVVTPPEPRWAGSISEQKPSETQFVTRERYVEHDVEWYDVTITCKFNTPPIVLKPESRYPISATFSHSGSNPSGTTSLGERFSYSMAAAGNATIAYYMDPADPREALVYFPYGSGFDGTREKRWMVQGPPIYREGETIQVYAGLHNRSACNVTWTYRAEYH